MTESPLAPHAASPGELKERLEAERRGECFLLYRDRNGRQQIHVLEDTASRKIRIGRAGDADVVLAWDPKVSGLHAELERIGGGWAIIDDGLSRNGTFVNGERLQGRARLADRDSVRLGDTVVVYCAPGVSAPRTTMASETQVAIGSLSDAQRKVLLALCRPCKGSAQFALPPTNQQIAEELSLSVDAVKTHLRVLFRRFGIGGLPQNRKRARLVELAFHSGLVSERDL